MNRNRLYLLLFLAGIAVRGTAFGQHQLGDTVTATGLQDYHMSLVRLLANPERYDGFHVVVQGYLHVRFEDNALYLSKTDADFLHGKNAVWVSFADTVKMLPILTRGQKDTVTSLKYFDGRYVTLAGTFDRRRLGHLGSFSGALILIDRISEDRQWYDGRKELWRDNLDGRGLQPTR